MYVRTSLLTDICDATITDGQRLQTAFVGGISTHELTWWLWLYTGGTGHIVMLHPSTLSRMYCSIQGVKFTTCTIGKGDQGDQREQDEIKNKEGAMPSTALVGQFRIVTV